MDLQMLEGASDGAARRPLGEGHRARRLRVRALLLGALAGGALALGLRHLLVRLGAIRGRSRSLLVHALLAHRRRAGDVAGRLLASTQELVQPTHATASLVFAWSRPSSHAARPVR